MENNSSYDLYKYMYECIITSNAQAIAHHLPTDAHLTPLRNTREQCYLQTLSKQLSHDIIW